ncbi:MAG: ABC transporter ATP-binding protein [Bacilli bacterium]
MSKEVLIEVKNLKKHFKTKKGTLKAVDNVSFEIYKGETFGLVGESGCGKSTLGRVITGLYSQDGGSVFYQDNEITNISKKSFKTYQKKMQIIFQDPYSSLNPNMNVAEIIEEPIKIHNNKISKQEAEAIVDNVLTKVGLDLDSKIKYPHEFSGGQRQRIGIARALSVKPEFILCDEPISALDVSIQAQIVNTLKDIQETSKVAYLFVAHDISMVKYISDRIGVMYLGRIIEIGTSDEIVNNPQHPYTKMLLNSIPHINQDFDLNQDIIQGDIPSPIDLPKGCRFQSRCSKVFDKCLEHEPDLIDINTGHKSACWLCENK